MAYVNGKEILFSSTIVEAGDVTAGLLEEIEAINNNMDAMAERIDKEQQGQDSRIDRNDKRITNLEKGIPSELFATDNGVAYIKDVPENALPFAEISKIGGMTYKDGGTLKSAKVTEVESVGVNLFDESQITHATTGAGVVSEAYGVVQDGVLIAKMGYHNYGIIWKPFAMNLGAGTYTISADCYISTGGAPNLRVVARLYNVKTQTHTSDTVISLSAFDKWERISAQITVAEASEYMLCVQGVGNEDLNSNMDVRFKNICVAKDVAEYSPYLKNSISIPEEVKALDGYGEGVDSNNFNSVEWSDDGKVIYRRSVKMIEFDGNEEWYKDAAGNTFWTSLNNFKRSQGEPLSSRYSCSIWDVLYVNASNTGVSTVEEFKAVLKADPLYVVYILDAPEIIDVSDLLPADNFIGIEGGGTVTMKNEYEYAVPSVITYMLKEA